MYDDVHVLHGPLQRRAVGEIPDDVVYPRAHHAQIDVNVSNNAVGKYRIGSHLHAIEPADLVPQGRQTSHQRAPDAARRTGDEDRHTRSRTLASSAPIRVAAAAPAERTSS